MGIYTSLKKLLWKSTDIRALVENYQGILMGQDPGYTPLSYGGMAREGYTYNSTARACIDTINTGLCSLPLYLMKSTGSKTDKEKDPNHPLLKLIKNPNPRMSKSELLEYLGGSLLLSGDAIIVPVNPLTRKGPPLGLYPLRPDLVQVDEIRANGIPTLRYVYTPSVDGQPIAEPTTYYEGEVIHIKLYNPLSGLRGLGVISAARMAIDRSNASEKWNYSLLKNSAKPSGILSTDKEIQENQKAQIEKKRDAMMGMLNVGKPPIMTNGLSWQQISLSPLDMDWLQGDQDAAIKIARAFRVPGQKIGIPGSQTYANMEQADRALYADAIIPLATRILDKLNQKLTPRYEDGLELLIDQDKIPAMRDNQNDLYNRANTAWWLSIDQKLQMTGYETIGGTMGKMIMVPANLLPLELVGTSDTGNGADSSNNGGGQGQENDNDNDDGGQGGNPFAPGGY